MLSYHAGENETLNSFAELSFLIEISFHIARNQSHELLGIVYHQGFVPLPLSLRTLHHLKVDHKPWSSKTRTEALKFIWIAESFH